MGGTSRLGLESGATIEQAVSVVRRGFELGINYFDSSQSYLTEGIFGEALEGHRDEVVLASKMRPLHNDGSLYQCHLVKPGSDVFPHFHRTTRRVSVGIAGN